MNVFAHNTYKAFFNAYIKENQQKGIVSKVAADCGCDRTYISQVLNAKADLTPDHIIQFCDRNGFHEQESRYLLLMLLRDRSSSLYARKSLDAKIAALKKKNEALTTKILTSEKTKEITEEMRSRYYSNWLYGATHILTSIEAYQTAPEIAKKLQISVSAAIRLLKDLEAMGLVRKENDRYIHASTDIYLPRNSPHTQSNHLGWRIRAVERSIFAEEVHYTSVFSVSKEDVEKIRQQIVQLIESQRSVVRASGSEVAFAFCTDFFAV